MKHYKETTGYGHISILDSITCDKCKINYSIYEKDGNLELQEFLKIDFIAGYNSVFGDGNVVLCDICQHCLKELIFPFYRVEKN